MRRARRARGRAQGRPLAPLRGERPRLDAAHARRARRRRGARAAARAAPLDLVDGRGRSALHWACDAGHAAVAAALLDGKIEGRGAAAIDLQDGNGHTPLVAAVRLRGREGLVRLLLARGARVAPQDADGWTAMHWAVAFNRAAVLALLCAAPDADAALALRTADGRTARRMARSDDLPTCEGIMRARGAPI